MNEGRCMLTSEVVVLVVLVVDSVMVEIANNTNNKVVIDIGNISDGDGK